MAQTLTKESLYGFTFREPDARRVDPEERKTYNIKQLWQVSHEIVNLAARGFKGTEIAEILNITPQTVSNTLNSELGRAKTADIRQERDEDTKKTIEKVRVLTDKALKTYHEIFDDESGQATLRDKKAVADTVLMELSGLRVPTKIDARHTSLSLTTTELEEFKRRGIAAARESGLIVDIPPAQVTDGTEPEAAVNKS